MDNMQDRMFDRDGNWYRDLTARIDEDNETTWGDVIKGEPEDRMFDRYGILDRDPALCIDDEMIVEEDYYSVVDRMKDIYAAKNSDYGNSFEMTLDKYGIIGAIIRMQDKMNRIDGYYWKPDEDKKVDESLIDTLEDLGNYAIMTSVWLRNQ